jgi:hypothetical protein
MVSVKDKLSRCFGLHNGLPQRSKQALAKGSTKLARYAHIVQAL